MPGNHCGFLHREARPQRFEQHSRCGTITGPSIWPLRVFLAAPRGWRWLLRSVTKAIETPGLNEADCMGADDVTLLRRIQEWRLSTVTGTLQGPSLTGSLWAGL